ncbi:MAG: hypothetical protein A3H69_05860 [Candidatus Sungbacteria bacterium RIFCSPLOWO2_02_FULL_47_9]|uniref:Nudix hydrolase domain-containing protein n=1 Tax=Candidatus Sungbacteria bacterium RIFCSPHIGHO2_01_FULL_47_32 TaxID=1802264 RepID=A0A1G2K2H0_9BACT|nr:MAG: ADP-ribose pyrophosphatase [Parcubacteria group bacterium GW2011_GWA2_47_10]OGZ93612.1 MAG: hypothetical protein A2633_04635 [Candidatus Sungbacteria bacterium RIFCSPHIGHO2_01_FULL_47_32]OHA05454.1 MAG: hypothetical protein A3A28_03095 [Candidatus Sungbacteria bacterium RIFCSPLOWO2_01_FULL_47_32]OHA08670.1 MAG: hypothetical protein A3H69_05860 [Candidatus Sungbacteria bacterium RIFCSPLOWO2_02_FULL_47_9]
MRKKSIDKNEIVARVVVIRNGRILLCRHKGKLYFFLPGGEVEFGELAKTAAIREMREETEGIFHPKRVIGAAENIYGTRGNRRHEVNVIYEGTLTGSGMSVESHIEFVWVPLLKFKTASFMPKTIKKALLAWFKNKKPFWEEENNL